MLLIAYIETYYGTERGNKASFLRDNPNIRPQELNRWINAELKVHLETGEIYKPTSKTIDVQKKMASEIDKISPKTAVKLKSCAEQFNLHPDEWLHHLMDAEMDRHRMLGRSTKQGHKNNPSVQVLSKIVNRHFASLSHASEMFEYCTVLEALTDELLEKKLLDLRVPASAIVESDILNIPRTAYYWYGGIAAKHISRLFGTLSVYLWHEICSPRGNEVVFVGAPNNVAVCCLVFERICGLLKRVKSTYKKDQGRWSNKQDIEDMANQYILRFVQGIRTDSCIDDEASDLRIIEYAEKRYSYAMD